MHKNPLIFAALVVAVLALSCSRTPDEGPSGAIRQVMETQVQAWNEGDIEGFLEGYIKSPELLFASRGTFSRGWDPLLERYRAAYPAGKMGELRFDGVDIHPVGDDAAWVTGSWTLEGVPSSPHGAFTLVFRKTQAGWKIVHDHTSSVDVSEEN